MPDPVITNVDLGSDELEGGKFRDEILTFAGADTFKGGTLLARRAVALAITPAAGGGNTGDGTVTLASVVAGSAVPKPGTYVLTCVAAATHGGSFKLEDPDGGIVADSLVLTGGSGGTTAFEAGGIAFTFTDGAADFVVGDTFDLPVVADGKLVPYNPGGAGGEQVPTGVLTYDVTRTAAGDEAIRALVAGSVKKERLIIDVDGDGSNITDAILDQLRSYGIVAIDTQELAELDNQ